MIKTGYVIGGLGLHGGAAALVLYFLNMAVWSVLTAMLGSGLALIGLGLIFWALYPRRAERTASEPVETDVTQEEAEAVPA